MRLLQLDGAIEQSVVGNEVRLDPDLLHFLKHSEYPVSSLTQYLLRGPHLYIELGLLLALVFLASLLIVASVRSLMLIRLCFLCFTRVDLCEYLDVDIEGNHGQQLRRVLLVVLDLLDALFIAMAEEQSLEMGIKYPDILIRCFFLLRLGGRALLLLSGEVVVRVEGFLAF